MEGTFKKKLRNSTSCTGFYPASMVTGDRLMMDYISKSSALESDPSQIESPN